MGNKRGKNATKNKIVSAAWKLFYEQGYEDTTIDDIVEASNTSKGSFYYYFAGKDALLGSLSLLFDEKYEALREQIDPEMDSFEKLLFLNQELFSMIENTISLDLIARLYSAQLLKGETNLLDYNRTYFKFLRHLILEGQARKQIRQDISVNEIVKIYAMCERAIITDWCICNGDYSLKDYAAVTLPMLLSQLRFKNI